MPPLESDIPVTAAAVHHRLSRWTGRVVFGSSRYDLPAIFLTVDARTPPLAVKRAVTTARRRLRKRTRIDRIAITLTRLHAPVAPSER